MLPDIQIGALSGDAQKQIDSIVRQLNEWARLISAETRVRTIKADDGSVIGMGQIPGTEEIGFFSLDPDGNLISKWVGATLYFYDADGKIVTTINKDGLTTYDADGKVMLRSGTNPNDTQKITVIGRQGEDALDNI